MNKEADRTLLEQFEDNGGSEMSLEEVIALVGKRAAELQEMGERSTCSREQFFLELAQMDELACSEIQEGVDKLNHLRNMRSRVLEAEENGLQVTYFSNDRKIWFEARPKEKMGFLHGTPQAEAKG